MLPNATRVSHSIPSALRQHAAEVHKFRKTATRRGGYARHTPPRGYDPPILARGVQDLIGFVDSHLGVRAIHCRFRFVLHRANH
jgi:hypothetical protein